MSTFINLRILEKDALSAQAALASGELVELRSRHGELLRGHVRSMQYLMGVDQGWFIVFEVADDRFLSCPIPRRTLH